MQIRIHLPVKSQLQEYATAVWEVVGARDIEESILPQGVVEIVFNFSHILYGLLPHRNGQMQAPRCFIQGINTHVVKASYAGQHHLFGVRLQPHRVKSLLGIQPVELKNTPVDLTLIKPEFGILWHQLIEAASFEERLQLVEKQLRAVAQTDCERLQRLSTLFVVGGIDHFQTVDALAGHICYSTRHLSRVVHDLFGMSAQELIIYKKFLHAVHLMHGQDSSLTQVAYQSGLYGQAHFCRIFKTYAGITPKQYQSSKSELPFHIIS